MNKWLIAFVVFLVLILTAQRQVIYATEAQLETAKLDNAYLISANHERSAVIQHMTESAANLELILSERQTNERNIRKIEAEVSRKVDSVRSSDKSSDDWLRTPIPIAVIDIMRSGSAVRANQSGVR